MAELILQDFMGKEIKKIIAEKCFIVCPKLILFISWSRGFLERFLAGDWKEFAAHS